MDDALVEMRSANASSESGGIRRVVVVGELIDRKRPWLGCEAVAYLPANVELILVGDGPLRKELETKFSELISAGRIHFLGRISRTEVLTLLSKTDLLLHTARREGAGWVVAEALACGNNVLTVRGSGADCLVARVPNGGAIVDDVIVNDAQALANAIIGLICAGEVPKYEGIWSESRFRIAVESWYA
ncbi:glycosyltransferase involved in cell wall biosynthesis [Rhodococcus fascians]|nr:glycosyltransferase involved in cell wall biosynthesis [Rhodococcus fascians]